MAQRSAVPAPPAIPACTITPRALSLTNVIGMLDDVADKKQTFACIEERIKKQGVTFERTPLVEETLRNYAATPGIINAINLPIPPPPVLPKIAGNLSVTCASPECEVFVQGRHQKTVGGKAEIKDLSPGKVPLVVYKEGFLLYSAEIDLIENQPKTASVQLQQIPPDPSLVRLKLKALLWDMVAATGGVDQIDGKGTLAWIVDEKKQSWDVTKFSKNAGQDLDITFKNTAGECKLKITGQVSKPLTCSKYKGDPKVDVVAAAKLFLTYQIHNVLNVISSRELIQSQSSMNRVETAGGADSYALTLNAESLPMELQHRIGDKDWTVQYLEYKTFEGGRYPTRMVIEEAKVDGKWEFAMSLVQPR